MPIEIRQVTIKAEVENKKENAETPAKENLDFKQVNLENLLEELYRKIQKKKER